MKFILSLSFFLIATFAIHFSAGANAQQSAVFEPVGSLKTQIEIAGQIAGGERQHAYKFSVAERGCVRIARKDTSVSLRTYLYDERGGLLQKVRINPARYRSKFIQQTIFFGRLYS